MDGMVTWMERRRRTPIDVRLDTLEAGQVTILQRIDALAETDRNLEGKIAAAVDRMTTEMVKQSGDFREAMIAQTTALRDSLVETRMRRAIIRISGRGLRWMERGAWMVAAALGWKMWSLLAHARGWDAAWWWPW